MTPEPVFVDAGNSRVKIARFHDEGWEMMGSGDYEGNDGWKAVFEHSLEHATVVYTSVSDVFEGWLEQGHRPMTDRLIPLRAADIPPARLDYETPHTLGTDRWLACA